MKRLAIASILALSLFLVSTVAYAAGVEVVSKTGDGVWVSNAWQVSIYPNETKGTTISLYNSSPDPMRVVASILPTSLDNGNLVFGLDRATFIMTSRSYADVVLVLVAHSGATPGTYTAELTIGYEAVVDGGYLIWQGDITPPTVLAVSAASVSNTSAEIRWQTSEASTSQVEYWASPKQLSPLDRAMVTSHIVYLTNLAPGTTYHYRSMSEDSAGNLGMSPEHTFATLSGASGASFICSNLVISSATVNANEIVGVSVLVTNIGDTPGTCEVVFSVDGTMEAIRSVTLGTGESKKVSFVVSRGKMGVYLVDVNGLIGSFAVVDALAFIPPSVPPTTGATTTLNWGLIWGIVGFMALASGLLVLRGRLKKRQLKKVSDKSRVRVSGEKAE